MSNHSPFSEPSPNATRGSGSHTTGTRTSGSRISNFGAEGQFPQQYAGPTLQESPPFGDVEPEGLGIPASYPRGPWGGWLRLTMPRPTVRELQSAAVREQMRRAQILVTLLAATVVVLAALILFIFSPSFNIGTLVGEVLGALIVLFSALMCRMGRVTGASTLYVLGLTIAIALSNMFFPTGKLSLQDVETFYLFAVPTVFAGILLPRRASILIWLGSAIFTVVDLLVQPEGPNLVAYLHDQNYTNIYPVAIQPVLLAAILAVASWVAAGSVDRAIVQADRTAEVAAAYQAIADQKRRLEEAVGLIQSVHARVANGDLSARAPISGGELVSLAMSLNLMLERLSRSMAAETALGGMEQSVQRLNGAVAELAQGRIGRPISQQGFGQLAPIAYNLEQLRSGFVQVARNSNAMVDRISATSHEVLTLNHSLVQALQQSATPDLLAYTRDRQERLGRMERELASVIEQLHLFLVRFTA